MMLPTPIVRHLGMPGHEQLICEDDFFQHLAAHIGASFEEVAQSFDHLSYNLRGLVHSPQGWTALSRILVTDPAADPLFAWVH
jgi:hypothetical protein